MIDFLTILRSRGPLLTKRWNADGTITPYDSAKTFTVREATLNDIRDLARELTGIAGSPQHCVIRGRAPADLEPEAVVIRRKTVFTEVPHHWVCFDVDGYEPILADPVTEPEDAITEFIHRHLPVGFHGVSYYWQLSSSAGAPGKQHLLKAHVWFWLAHPRTSEELTAWVRATGTPIDVATLRTVQAHFTADPVLAQGIVDPVPRRSGLIEGVLSDEAELELSQAILVAASRATGDRDEMVDPTTKQGPIGAFCRAFSPEDVIDEDLCEGAFEWDGDSRVRITWVHGGGTQGGLCITDDGLHIYSAHNTDPFHNRAVNMFDFVRVHRNGHLDRDLTDFELNDPALCPSQRATIEWALTLPQVQAQLQAEREDKQAQAVEEARALSVASAPQRQPIEDAIALVLKCEDARALETLLAPEFAKTAWGDLERERLAKALQTRARDLTGVSLPIATARGWLRPKTSHTVEGPEWLNDWVYITDSDQFFHLRSKKKVTPRGFDAENSAEMPLRQDGIARESAAFWAVNVWSMKTADSVLYAPGLPDVFTMAGRTWANAYREDSVPETEPPSDAGNAAIALVQRHLELLFPDDTERGILLSWMAHNVQRPGRKIRWAPYIQGPTGAGKTFIAEVMSMCMGPQNVRVLSNSTLHAPFTPWVTGHALIVLEEIHQTGRGYETADILKAPVSNDTIDVHRKGKDAYQAPNFTNYLALSNHSDGVPIDDSDRRWLFLQCALTQRAAEKLGQAYFDPLFETCRAHAGALRGWLLGMEMHPAFSPHDRAYKTAARQRVIEMCKSDETVSIADFVEGRDLVSLGELETRIQRAGGEMLKSRRVKKTLETLGFKWAGRVTIDRHKHTVYIRDHLDWNFDRTGSELRKHIESGDFGDFGVDGDRIAA